MEKNVKITWENIPGIYYEETDNPAIHKIHMTKDYLDKCDLLIQLDKIQLRIDIYKSLYSIIEEHGRALSDEELEKLVAKELTKYFNENRDNNPGMYMRDMIESIDVESMSSLLNTPDDFYDMYLKHS